MILKNFFRFDQKIDRHLPLISIVLISLYLVYGFSLVLFSNKGFPVSVENNKIFPYLSDKPLGEDGYYMFSVAWNIAKGKGLIYNFDQPTTGIQPLNTIILAGISKLVQLFNGDKWIFTRSILLYEILIMMIFAKIISNISLKLSSSLNVSGIWVCMFSIVFTLFNFSLFRIITYGLETGLYLLFLSLLVNYSLTKGFQKYNNQAIVFGLMAGLVILARIDFIIVLLIFHLLSTIKLKTKLSWTIISLTCSLGIVSPWFYYVFSLTGKIIPSSGIAQIAPINGQSFLNRIIEFSRSLISHLFPWIYSRPYLSLSIIGLVGFGFLLVLITRNTSGLRAVKAIFRTDKNFLFWMIGIFILNLIYLLFFKSTHFYTRYFAPINVIYLPILAILFVLISHRFKEIFRVVGFIALPCTFFLWSFLSFHTGITTNTQPITAGFVQRELSSQEKIGSFQSGVVGYFNENVVNLDGKIDHRVIHYIQEGQLNIFIDAEEINVLIDWEEIIYKFLPRNYLQKYWKPCDFLIPDQKTICLVRK